MSLQFTNKRQKREVEMMLAAAQLKGWQVARAMGVSPSTFSGWKLGYTPAPEDFVQRVNRTIDSLRASAHTA